MQSNSLPVLSRTARILALSLFASTAVAAQGRLVLPAGSVIIVRTTQAIESSTARTGQTFETIVLDSVGVDNYTVIPANSRIRGTVSFARAATRQESGVVEVSFDRITLSDGTSYPIVGRLTSTDAAERRQIDADPNARVVLVGGRGGIGAAIAGAGSDKSPASGILAALGGLLSQAQDVRVPSGTPLAVQLDQSLVLRGRGRLRASDALTIYTAADRIRAAQQALATQNYYRGSITGVLDDATQRALFEFQSDRGIRATGNLDGRTAEALGVSLTTSGTTTAGGYLSPGEAATVRRNAQTIVGRVRQDIGISGAGRLNTTRSYGEGDVDLWFALSAFADNASLYEQLTRGGVSNNDASILAGRALLNAATRVDSALQRARPSYQVQQAWATLRTQLRTLDSGYNN